jgi:hypothetical protein
MCLTGVQGVRKVDDSDLIRCKAEELFTGWGLSSRGLPGFVSVIPGWQATELFTG